MPGDLLTIPYPRTIDAARAEGLTLIRDVTTGAVHYACPDPVFVALVFVGLL